MSATALPKPTIRIRAHRGWRALELPEMWRYRELLWTLAVRDIKVRYKQTVLGVLWVVLQPLLGAGIFTFIFGKVADLPMAGVPYFLGSFAGFQAWGLFSQTISKSAACLVGNTHLIGKIYFPRLILPGATVPTTLVDFVIAMLMLAVLMVIWRVPVGWEVVCLPLAMIGLIALGLGVGLICAALAVRYRDVKYVVPVFTQLLLYLSPVGYAVLALRERLRDSPVLIELYMLNPVAGLIEAFRWALFANYPAPQFGHVVYAFCLSLLIFAAGCVIFRNMERGFADVI